MAPNNPTEEPRVLTPSEQLTDSRNTNSDGNHQNDTALTADTDARVPEDTSTSLFISGLPPNFSDHQFLDHITTLSVGRIRSTSIHEPTSTRPNSAVTISFFRRQDAENLFNIIQEGWLRECVHVRYGTDTK